MAEVWVTRFRRRRRWVLCGSAILCVAVVSLVPALGRAQEPDWRVSFEFSPESGPAGTVLQVTGTCWVRGYPLETFWIGVTGNQMASTYVEGEVGEDGSWSASLPIAAAAPPGSYTVGGHCGLQDQAFAFDDQVFTLTSSDDGRDDDDDPREDPVEGELHVTG